MQKEIVVYTQPGCAPCNEVKLWLRDHDYTYTERNIRQDDAALQELIAAGFRATPVTYIDGEAIAGYHPAEMKRLLS